MACQCNVGGSLTRFECGFLGTPIRGGHDSDEAQYSFDRIEGQHGAAEVGTGAWGLSDRQATLGGSTVQKTAALHWSPIKWKGADRR